MTNKSKINFIHSHLETLNLNKILQEINDQDCLRIFNQYAISAKVRGDLMLKNFIENLFS